MHANDLYRLSGFAFFAAIAGFALGDITLGLLIGLGAYCIWLHRHLNRLLDWIRNRKQAAAPDPRGVFEELCREIDYLRERHKRRKKKLGNYLKQFQQATRALPDSTVVLDELGAVTWANKAAKHVLGIRWPEDGGQRITNLIRDPALVKFFDAPNKNASIDLASPIDPKIQLNVRVTPSGNRQRLFVARDVTELHRAHQIRSDFVANVSHELRTPLTVLRGYLENMTAQKEQGPQTWQAPLEQMSDHVNRMQAVVEDLLVLSKLEQHDELAEVAPVRVAELIADIHRQTKDVDAGAEHIFSLEVDTDLTIKGSAKELASCFSNLIFNAIHYTQARGVIEIRWYRDEAGAHFSVQDNGVGIGEEHIERLTERFYRVDNSRARSGGGTGLGLAIVKHVLNRHQASLHIDSVIGVGSTFRCDFPADVIVASEDALQRIDESA